MNDVNGRITLTNKEIMKKILLITFACALLSVSQAQLNEAHTHTEFNKEVTTNLTNFFKTPIYFKANHSEGAVNLIWHTPSRGDFKGFEISRSSDGENFERLSWISKQPTTTDIEEYTYDDYSVEKHQKYTYRLKKMNEDGSVELAQVEAVAKFDAKKANIEVVPKIEENQSLLILSNTEGVIKIFNSLGHPIAEDHLKIGENHIDTTFWSRGKYYVAFETETGEKILKKFFK